MSTETTEHSRQRKSRPTLHVRRRATKRDEVRPANTIDAATRLSMISDTAYFLAERRGFGPGHELDDWLKAEEQVDRALSADATGGPRDQFDTDA
jgi:hypothetical protein